MRYILFLLFLIICFGAASQQTDHQLQKQVQALIKDFNGDVGIYVHDLRNNRVVSINADTIFPTASIVKIPILIGIMNRIRVGELNYHQRLTYTDSLYYSEGDDILSAFKDSATIELSKVMMLMLTISDNCASLWLQGLSGGGSSINRLLDSLGLQATRVNSRTPGRENNRGLYGWGQTSPREIALIMERIVKKEMLDKASSEKMLRLLSRQYWDEQALSEIPAGVFTADKNGAVDESRNEVLYVNCQRNPYIFSIFTKNNRDKSWNADNEAWVLTRKLSGLLWKYYSKN
jgi:beta-lactamase class A